MKQYLAIAICLLAVAGCQQVADVSALPEPYRRWAVSAFAQEGVDSCIHCDGPSIEVRLDPSLAAPLAGFTDIAQGHQRIRLRLDRMHDCGTYRLEYRFKTIVRHESRHAFVPRWLYGNHSNNPNDLMYDSPPCFPVD